MQNHSFERGDTSVAAECSLLITRAEAEAGTRRVVHFYGADGRERGLLVDVPAGVTTGTRLPVAPEEADANGLSFGSLVVAITVLPHIRSECRGADVYVTVQSDRASAERDGEVRVPLSDGRVLSVPVRQGMSHDRFVYAGQGLLRGYAPARRGDLILRLELLDLHAAAERAERPAEPQRRWWRSLLDRER